MMFQKKVDRAMEWLREQNQTLGGESRDLNREKEEQNNVVLEKKDIIAMLLSALIVFGPLILILCLIAVLMYI